MLVLSPTSTCDVCLKCYTSGDSMPHAITCGHIFCLECLESLIQPHCPLCHARFSPRDVRKLHVIDHDPARVDAPQQIDSESQRLLDDIMRLVKEGGTISETRRVIDECRAHYKSQPGNQYTIVRVSCLLLHNLLATQRKVATQAEQLAEVRNRSTSELAAVQLKYDNLERASRDEKDTALAIEKSLREHYDMMNSFWKGQLASVDQECRSLRTELHRYRSSGATTQAPPRATELQYLHRSRTDDDLFPNIVVEPPSPPGVPVPLPLPMVPAAPPLTPYTNDSGSSELEVEEQMASPTQGDPEPEFDLEIPGTTSTMAHPLSPDYPQVLPVYLPSRTQGHTHGTVETKGHLVSKLHDLLGTGPRSSR